MSDAESFLVPDHVTEIEDDTEETRRNIRLIVRIRYIVSPSVFVILALASFAGLSRQGSFSENQLVVNGVNLAVLLILNVIYLALSRRLGNLRPLVLFQLLIDVIHITLTVYKTGGVASPFGFLYFFVIFEAAILRGGRSTYVIAAISAALYSLTTLLERVGWLPRQEFFSPLSGLTQSDPFLVLSWSFAIASYFGFAALAGYLTGLLARRQRRLRQAYRVMTRRHETLMLLHRTSTALNSFESPAEICDAILGELLQHLSLDRALLYRVTADAELALYMVKERTAGGGTRDAYAKDAYAKDAYAKSEARSNAGDQANAGGAKANAGDQADLATPQSVTADTVAGLRVRIPLAEGAGLTARCAVRQEAYNVTDPEASELINRELARQIGMNPFALAPLVVRGKTIGVIGIDRRTAVGGIQNEEFRIVQVFANQAAITLHSVEPDAPAYVPGRAEAR
ncbi:MAG: GAF domain-containing protein [Spirochaetota bacterium]